MKTFPWILETEYSLGDFLYKQRPKRGLRDPHGSLYAWPVAPEAEAMKWLSKAAEQGRPEALKPWLKSLCVQARAMPVPLPAKKFGPPDNLRPAVGGFLSGLQQAAATVLGCVSHPGMCISPGMHVGDASGLLQRI